MIDLKRNSKRELVEAITGLRSVVSGSILMNGKEMSDSTAREISEEGISHIPENREKHGLVGPHSVADNLVLNRYFHSPFASRGIRQTTAINDEASHLVEKFDVRTASIHNPARTLSGGNKQKVIAARELSHDSELLLAAQPTRGIDVGSIEFIHQQLVDQRDSGVAVLLVSAELDEILSLSDRIGVIYQGQLVAIAPTEEFTRTQIGQLMTSGSD